MFLTVISIIFIVAITAFVTRHSYKSEIIAIKTAHKAEIEGMLHSARSVAWEDGFRSGENARFLSEPETNPYK